jgi:hypothetical protein
MVRHGAVPVQCIVARYGCTARLGAARRSAAQAAAVWCGAPQPAQRSSVQHSAEQCGAVLCSASSALQMGGAVRCRGSAVQRSSVQHGSAVSTARHSAAQHTIVRHAVLHVTAHMSQCLGYTRVSHLCPVGGCFCGKYCHFDTLFADSKRSFLFIFCSI